MPPLLVLGTGNRKKGQELAHLFAPLAVELRTLADFPDAIEVVEDGDTFSANATLKATQQARHLGHWVLADDSGLMVDALGGRPGVLSARYSGPGATDASNNQKVLEQLGGIALERRTAQFVCDIVLSDPVGRVRAEVAASCRGRILDAPQGEAGFGYDPLFEIVEYHRTFGQLSAAVKSVLSHRARASIRLVPHLVELIDRGELR